MCISRETKSSNSVAGVLVMNKGYEQVHNETGLLSDKEAKVQVREEWVKFYVRITAFLEMDLPCCLISKTDIFCLINKTLLIEKIQIYKFRPSKIRV